MNDFILSWMGNPILNLTAVILLLTAALGVGGTLLHRLMPTYRPPLTVALCLGLILLAWLALTASPLILAAPAWAVWLFLLPGAAAGILTLRRADPGRWLRQHWIATGIILLAVLWFGASTLLPPFSWDEQTYQLALPVHWLAEGSTRPTPDLPYSGFPLLPQFLVMLLLKMAGLATARMLILLLFGVLFLTLYDELQHYAGQRTAILLTVIFALSPLVLAMIREFYAEVFLALPLLAAWQLRRLTGDDRNPHQGWLYGILAGGVAAVKLTGAGTSLAILMLAIPPGFFRRINRRENWLTAGGFLLAAVVLAAPFYLRPALFLGNPCYPFLGGLFGTPSPELEAYHHAMGDFRYGIGWLPGIAYSWLFTAFYEDIYDGITTGWPFAVCALAAPLLCYLAWWRGNRPAGAHLLAGAITLVLYLFWCVTAQQTRFLLPLYPILLIFAAQGLATLGNRFKALILGVLLLGGALSFDWYAFRHGWYSWMLTDLSLTRPAEVLARAMRGPDMVSGYHYLLQNTPPETRVLLLFDRRSLYCPRFSRNGTPGFQEWIDWGDDPQADLMPKLREHRIDCILLNTLERNPDQLEVARNKDIALAEQLRGALRRGDLVMEEIPDSPAMLLLRVRKPSF